MERTTQEEVEEGSGSRSRKGRRRHTHGHEPAVTDDLSKGTEPEAEPSSQRGKRKAASEQSEGERREKKREGSIKSNKKATASASPSATASPGATHAPEGTKSSKKKATASASPGATHASEGTKSNKKKATASASPGATHASEGTKSNKKKATASESPGATHASEDSEASSGVSSPLRFPPQPNPDDFGGRNSEYHAASDAFDDLLEKYHAKRRRQLKLITLDPYMPSSCLVQSGLRSVREPLTETVLHVARVVFSLSSYIDGKPMTRSSGFLIHWDEETRTGTLLTSAHIICSKFTPLSQWLGTDEYAPNAEVLVHLLDKDDTTVTAKLLHFDKQINIALFTVGLESCAKIPKFNSNVKYGEEIFVIGRDDNLNLTVDRKYVEFMGPNGFERHHYMFTSSGIRESSVGGPVIDFNGDFLGMANFPGAAFIPSSIISWCLDMWNGYHCIPRLHIGMKFSAIKFLDPTHVERIFRKFNVDSGLIVTEVSNGSVAEELGVRPGDIINSINGECIPTVFELEKLTMRICKNHLDQGGTIGSSVDVPVTILHVRKGHEVRRVNLRLNVLDGMEVFARE